jgi:hydrogenase maturation protease
MDVAFQMRGVPEVILVDACSSGSEPGSLFEVPGHEVENLPPLTGINLHAFRWDHAIAFGHWLLKDDYPANVTAYLIEGERYEIGDGLSPAVDAAVDRLVDLLLAMHGIIRQPPPPAPPEPPLELVQLQLPGDPGGWYEGPKVADVTSKKPVTFEEGGAKILVLRVKDELRAFRNACGHVGLPLDRGMCDAEAGTITCPWHGFRFDADTGACLSTPECRLEPFPLRVTAGVVWVKPS